MSIMGEKLRLTECEIDKLDNEAIVFMKNHNKVVVLNQSAFAIFTALQTLAHTCNDITCEAICDVLMDEYNYINVNKEDMVIDIREVLDSFRSLKLLEIDE